MGASVSIDRRGNVWGVVLRVALVLFFAGYLVQVLHRTRAATDGGHFGDFRHFYFASRALLDHTDLYTSGDKGYLYPPLIAMLYTPVARLTMAHAARVILLVNVAMAFFGVLLAAREYADRFDLPTTAGFVCGAALLGSVLNLDKIHMEFQMFQTNALMFLMFILALRWLDRRQLLAGVPLGIIFNIKYLSLAMLPWLIVRRRWKTAGAFILSAIGFALLPAIISGWNENLRDLNVAYGGLLHMVGIGKGVEQANVEDIRAWFSCSITSGMARMTMLGPSMMMAMIYVAMIALISLGVVVMIYRREKMPLFAWPAAAEQVKQPWKGMIGLEYAALLAASLCFSPQTNTKHLFLGLLITIPAAVLLLGAQRGVPSYVVGVGVAIMLAAFSLPPGNRFSEAHHLSLLWIGVGGPCWGLLIALFTLLSVGMMHVRRAGEWES
jgi:Glycosyltransferase family 87